MAGKTLLGLSQGLLKVASNDQAAIWASLLATFHTQYGKLPERADLRPR